MSLFSRLFGPKRTENIVVYVVSAVVDGNIKATPIGSAPSFTRSIEADIKRRHRPTNGAILDDLGCIMCWANDGIDAISFIRRDQAEAHEGFKAFDEADRLRLDPYLRHFPR